ncbi:MAG TPA: glycosyltransferase family 2 protein [Rubrobacter sp.]|nr:glycosyltransferase family 2 protein [Rubrobacter sp.]
MSPRVAVVIPNWNTREFLGPCLESLRRQTFRDFETVVVDSASTDGSVGFVEENFPEVRTLALPGNRGFSGAVNAGIRASDAELVALLNNDTEQDPGWLGALVEAADRRPEAGLFASKLVDFEDRRMLDGAGDALRASGIPYRLGHGEVDRGQFEREGLVFGACAAAALYRGSLFENIGLFDEDFFAYCEDADLSFRAQLAGYGCLYVPQSVVYHVGSVSTGGKRSATATRLGARNSVSLLVKNLPLSAIPHVLPFFVLEQVARLLVAAATGSLPAQLRGLSEARSHLPLMLKKRRQIQAEKRVSGGEIRALLRRSAIEATKSIARRARDRISVRLGLG